MWMTSSLSPYQSRRGGARGKIAEELSRRVAAEPDNRICAARCQGLSADIDSGAFCAGTAENVHLLPGVDSHALTPGFRVWTSRRRCCCTGACWTCY